jgi:hypothetical protein
MTYQAWVHQQFLRTTLKSVRLALLGEWEVAQVLVGSVTVPVTQQSEVREFPTQMDVTLTLTAPRVPALSKLVVATKAAFKKTTHLALTAVIALSIATGLFLVTPALYYKLTAVDTVEIPAQTSGTPMGGDFAPPTQPVVEKPAYQPPVDTSLPEGKWLIIPRIGVRTQLQETEDSLAALDKGVWMVPGYGQPGETKKPLIAAAHRFGWKWWWQSDYWKYHSFYLLPELEPGDTVEVIADQRKWIYEVYAGNEGDEITDYEADLILYTCKFLDSPVRHFRYARLIDPTVNTQAG